VCASGDASDYLGEGNKLETVLGGLNYLREGRPETGLPPDHAKLIAVAGELARRLVASDLIDLNALQAALARDGFILQDGYLESARPEDAPADRLAVHILSLFGNRGDLAVARNHYEQASRAFDRGDWEAANAQFRSAFDATYDALAWSHDCPTNRRGGATRQWLGRQGLIADDESELLKSFAGRNGSHAGLSDATDSQLRRHFATALIAFGIGKLG
jgi:hypothetical protein